LTEATMVLVPCQMRSKTESPCTNRAVVEIRGIAFCEACAREQEAYFAIGELTQETQGLRSKQLAEVLERLRRERTGGRGGVAEMHHGLPGVNETECLALTKS
jgi:hypothetical protein